MHSVPWILEDYLKTVSDKCIQSSTLAGYFSRSQISSVGGHPKAIARIYNVLWALSPAMLLDDKP